MLLLQPSSLIFINGAFSSHIFSGAIAVTGGLFSNGSVPVVIGNVECSGNESGLFNCSFVNDSDDTVIGCDPEGIASVTCQG